jgi:CCR4-NOT transcription complex subunit 1
MAMITCRDHLLQSIKNHLKHFMVTLGRNLTQQQTEAIETTVTVIANDNVELACAFIQKKAIEKAILEVDKRLKMEYEQRLVAKKEGRRYYDQVAMTYQQERMPEHIKLKVGGASSQQSAVYDEFARNVPGFKPLTERELLSILPMATPEMRVGGNNAPAPMSSAAPGAPGTGAPPGSTAAGTATSQPQPQQPPTAQLVTSEECVAILDEVYSKVEPFVTQCNTLPTNPHMANLRTLVENLALARNSKEVSHVVILINKAVEALLEGLTPHIQPVETESLARYRDANLLVLRALADDRAYGLNWTKSRVTAALVEARDDIKYNPDAVDCFIRSGMVNLFEYDKHLATAVGEGNNVIALTFAMHLCKMYLIDDRSNAHIIEADLFGTIEALQKIATHSPRPPEGMVHLMEMIKMSSERLEQSLAMSGPTAQLHSGIAQAKEFEDPPGLLEKTEYLLREWVNAYHSRDAGKDSRQAFIVFVQLMNQHGILKTDDLITRFFRMSTQMCVDLCYRALSEPNNSPTLVRAKCFHTLDAYVRLITLLVKHSGETQNTVTKVNLLNKVLGIVAGVLLIDHEVRQTNFQQVPYHRIFIMLFLELNSPDAILENINFQVLTAYCNMLHILRPAKAPGFAFAWLEVVSHRVFLGRILAQTAGQKGWPMFAQLLVDLFKFLSPFLRNAELAKPVHRLYRGTLRVLLVLLHDFPEFLCDYHYSFCDVIPPNCIQMRNLILSAFPRNMRLPDPFTPNLKVELLPEISIAPRTVSNYAAMLKPNFKKDLDSYLKNRSPVAFVSDLRGQLQVSNGESPGNRYNIQLINALVMYVGTSAIQYLRTKGLTPTMSAIAHTSHMDIFQNLAVDLDTEGRYLFLNCIANQLRYPNSHTQYFSCTLLYLFAEANQESIQEQITRVLLERLIVNRPHPWGLLITFIELIKNRNYNFWSHEFVQCAPEIQKLFESVARSCMVHSPPRMDNHGQPVPAAPGTGSNPQLGLTNEQQAQQQQVQQQQQQQQQHQN